METVHVALPSDENYIVGLTATAGSMAYHASRDVVLSIHVLDGGIHDDTFDAFAKRYIVCIRMWSSLESKWMKFFLLIFLYGQETG